MKEGRGSERRILDKGRLLVRILRRGWVASKARHHIDAVSVIHDFRDRKYAESILEELAREGLVFSAEYPALTRFGLKRATALRARRAEKVKQRLDPPDGAAF